MNAKSPSRAVVIGGGLGGLAAAIRLGAAGVSVTLLEAAHQLGGKAGTVVLDGVEVDTGPSVLTMPEVLDELLRHAGMALSDHITLRSPSPGFRYLYADGTQLDVHHHLEDTLQSVDSTLGSRARTDLAGFLDYSRQIWDAASPYFVKGPAPTLPRLLGLGFRDLLEVRHIDALRTMRSAIDARVESPHLRMLLARYATYNGSDYRVAPGTLNCIAHVELALGGFGIQGGIGHMVEVLAEAARRTGVRIRLGARVERILVDRGTVTGVRTADGCVFPADQVVSNAEVAHAVHDLLPSENRRAVRLDGTTERSMSGWTGVLRAKRRSGAEARVAHTVLFPEVYSDEFADIFDHDRPPVSPTVYLCAQEPCHGRTGWTDDEPVFAMANTPPEPLGAERPASTWSDLQETVRDRLQEAHLIDAADRWVWTRTPAELAARFPGSRGALYGASSNDRFSAFKRPPNRVSGVKGLFFASGSAHPGGGMPLAMLSGVLAAQAALAD
jgi:phytoene desaturase